jgi:hypothetical protein
MGGQDLCFCASVFLGVVISDLLVARVEICLGVRDSSPDGMQLQMASPQCWRSWGFCKFGQIQEAINLMRKIAEIGFVPDCISYSTIINELCKMVNLTRGFWIFLISLYSFVMKLMQVSFTETVSFRTHMPVSVQSQTLSSSPFTWKRYRAESSPPDTAQGCPRTRRSHLLRARRRRTCRSTSPTQGCTPQQSSCRSCHLRAGRYSPQGSSLATWPTYPQRSSTCSTRRSAGWRPWR